MPIKCDLKNKAKSLGMALGNQQWEILLPKMIPSDIQEILWDCFLEYDDEFVDDLFQWAVHFGLKHSLQLSDTINWTFLRNLPDNDAGDWFAYFKQEFGNGGIALEQYPSYCLGKLIENNQANKGDLVSFLKQEFERSEEKEFSLKLFFMFHLGLQKYRQLLIESHWAAKTLNQLFNGFMSSYHLDKWFFNTKQVSLEKATEEMLLLLGELKQFPIMQEMYQSDKTIMPESLMAVFNGEVSSSFVVGQLKESLKIIKETDDKAFIHLVDIFSRSRVEHDFTQWKKLYQKNTKEFEYLLLNSDSYVFLAYPIFVTQAANRSQSDHLVWEAHKFAAKKWSP